MKSQNGRKPLPDDQLSAAGRATRIRRAKKAAAQAAREAAGALAVASGAVQAVEVPEGLSVAELRVWRDLAPHALAARTLTASTARAFADLCEAVVIMRRMLGMVEAAGWTVAHPDGTVKAHPMIARWQAQVARVDMARGRFLITATGRPAAETWLPKPKASPWSAFDQPLRVVGGSKTP